MQPWSTILHEVLALLDGDLNTSVFDLVLIILDSLQSFRNPGRHFGLTERSHLIETSIRLNRHDSGEDWNGNSHCLALLNVCKEGRVVVEKLGDNQVSTCI